MIQTSVLEHQRSGAILLMDAKQIKSPNGRARSRVRKKSFPATKRPSNRVRVTLQKEVSVEKDNRSH